MLLRICVPQPRFTVAYIRDGYLLGVLRDGFWCMAWYVTVRGAEVTLRGLSGFIPIVAVLGTSVYLGDNNTQYWADNNRASAGGRSPNVVLLKLNSSAV